VVAVGAFITTRDSAGGLGGVRPNHVGLIDPETNEIVAQIPVGIRPGPVALGADAAWVGNVDDRTLTKIDPIARSAVATISLERRTPTGIAVGLGAVWVAHGLRGELSRVDPQFGEVAPATRVAGTAFGSAYGSVAIGARSVWTVFGDSTLARLDTSGRVLEETLAGSQPAAIVVADDSAWVANSAEATVQRFNTASFRQGAVGTFNVGRRPTGIAYVDGAIWVASSGDDVVTRIDPASGATLPIAVGDGPSAVAGTPGAVWVANTAGGTMSRIDPGTNEVVATVDVGNAPSGLAARNGLLWVTVQAP
jgi:YVTN family beta-propeller protein